MPPLALRPLSAALLGATLALPAMAEEVVLTSLDQSVSLRGDLIEFDGESFRIETILGELLIDAFQVSCEGPGCPPPELLRSEFSIAGSNTIGAALMPALIEAYGFSLGGSVLRAIGTDPELSELEVMNEAGNTVADITLRSAGSSTSFRSLADGSAVIGMSSRPIQDAEAAALTQAGVGDFVNSTANETILAIDGLIVVVNRQNPVQALTLDQIAQVFSGQIDNWSEVGGPDAPITVNRRDDISGTSGVFEELVMEPLGTSFSPAAVQHTSNADLSDAVARDPNGIGFTGFAFERNARAISIAGVCGIQTPANEFTIKTEEYPLSRRLYLYTPEGPMPPQARSLLEFVVSEEAQPIIADAGFIDQAVTRSAINDQGLRMAQSIALTEPEVTLEALRDMMRTLLTAERLSTTFRFLPGSTQLDARAGEDARRLISRLSSDDFQNSEILLVGYTDSVGRADLNAALSKRRADQVLSRLEQIDTAGALADLQITTVGYGELSPLGCNETFEGRSKNRRVEVWVRPAAQNI